MSYAPAPEVVGHEEETVVGSQEIGCGRISSYDQVSGLVRIISN